MQNQIKKLHLYPKNKQNLMRKFIWHILNKLRIASIIQLVLKSGLKDDGWFKSYYTKQAVNRNGEPIPWCTYPFIKFIEERLKKDFDVFEYGCGNSTLWYANKVKSITSVEHDLDWYNKVSKILPENAKVIYKKLVYEGEYSKAVFDEDKQYHIIIIDGRDRVNSAKNIIKALTDDGVIIFDNTDRQQYKEGVDYLLQNNFKKIDFWGLSPVTAHENLTSVFYKSSNCLNI